jgi:hypothetical protein
MLPREGHLKEVRRILSYLKIFPKGRVIINTSYPDHSMYPAEDHSNLDRILSRLWKRNSKGLLPEKGTRVMITLFATVYVDADNAHDLVTKRSIAGILVKLIDGYPSVRRHWRYQLMAQNWWHQGLLRN